MLPTSIQVQRRAPGLPCAMALRLIRDRPGDPAFCDTIALRPRWQPSNLTPASGRRTQTISPYVKCRARQSRPYVHRFPAPRLRRWPTPLWWDRMAGVLNLICPTGPAIYFCFPALTSFLIIRNDLPVGAICRRNFRLLRRATRYLGSIIILGLDHRRPDGPVITG